VRRAWIWSVVAVLVGAVTLYVAAYVRMPRYEVGGASARVCCEDWQRRLWSPLGWLETTLRGRRAFEFVCVGKDTLRQVVARDHLERVWP
jgi:hypothetical protein